MTAFSPPPRRPHERYRRFLDQLHRRYWRKHRGEGLRPIVDDVLGGMLSAWFGKVLLGLAVLAAISPIFAPLTKYSATVFFGAGGLILDVAGVLLVFKEWVLQYREIEADKYSDIDRRVGMASEEDLFVFEEDEPRPVEVARHMADDVRYGLALRVVPALSGIICLVLGFVYQLTSLVLSALPK